MKLVAGGDSFVWGNELSDYKHCGKYGHSSLTFPALLSAGNYNCVAYPGIGNREISSRVKKAIDSNCKVLVSWTWATRDNKFDSDEVIVELEQFLQKHKIKYMFTCADNSIITNKIDYSNWFLFPPGKENHQTNTLRGFYQWAVEEGFACGFRKHPLDEAHKAAAQLMQDKFLHLTS